MKWQCAMAKVYVYYTYVADRASIGVDRIVGKFYEKGIHCPNDKEKASASGSPRRFMYICIPGPCPTNAKVVDQLTYKLLMYNQKYKHI